MAKIVTTTITEKNVDIANNKSDLEFSIYICPNNTSTYCTNRPLTITCNEITKSGSVTIAKGGSQTLTFIFANIQHENDGSKSVNWSWNCPTSTSGLGNLEYSGTYKMKTIPRKSSISLPYGLPYVGQPIVVDIDKGDSSFTHNIWGWFYVQIASGQIDFTPLIGETKTSLEQVNLTFSETALNQILGNINKDKTSVQMYISCETFSGDTSIGTTETSIMNMNIQRINPTVNPTIIDTNPVTVEFTGDNNKIIKHLSKPKITVNATAKQYADIKSYSIGTDSGTFYEHSHTFSNGITSPNVLVNATDTRNWDNPTPYDLSANGKWIDYEKVILNCEYCERIEQTSSTVKCKLMGTFFNNTINGTTNNLALSYRYRKQGENWQDNWITIPSADVTISSNNFTYTNNVLRTDCSDSESWEFQFKANDILMTTPIITKQITLGLGIIEIAKEFVNINGDFFVKDYPVKTINDMGNITVDSITSKNLFPSFESEVITSSKTYYFDKPLSPGNYTLSVQEIISNGANGKYLFVFKNGSTEEGAIYPYLYDNNYSVSFTTTREFDRVTVYSQNSWANSQNITTTFKNIMLEKGEQKTAYVPYHDYKNTITAVSNFLTQSSACTILEQNFFKQGNHYWGTAVISKNNGVFDYSEQLVATLPYTIHGTFNSGCFLSDGQWSAQSVGYLYVGGKNIIIADSNETGKYSIAKINIDMII